MKTTMEYGEFCVKLQQAVDLANPEAAGKMHRYEFIRLEEEGPFHLALIRMAGTDPITYDIARVMMRVLYPDMTKDEFMALGDHVISGRTKIEVFDAIPVHVLYEAFCDWPQDF